MSAPAIRSRKPTGVVPYPLVLVEGDEKGGKSWAAILLAASARVGFTYVIDLGEGGADEYGLIPGVKDRFEIIEHDGTWNQIATQILAVKAEAARAKAAGEPPVVLVIDSMTDLWNGLKGWVDDRHRKSKLGRKQYAEDPDGEHKPSQNLWNDANSRHRRLMTHLMTFPGIVVLTARGKEVTDVKNGEPVRGGAKVWSVDAQKDVPFDASVWVRVFRTSRPIVVGARSVHVGIKPGEQPQPINEDHENLLDWLIFDVLKVDPGTAATRDLQHTTGGELTADERAGQGDAGQGDTDQRADRAQPARPERQDMPPADAAAQAARNAAGIKNADQVRALYRAVTRLLNVDVRAALTEYQLSYSPVPDGKPVDLAGWLTTCGEHAAKESMSINDSIAADPTIAPREAVSA